MKQPSNKLKHPIKDLIAKLQSLPEGTTYEEQEGVLYGGEVPECDLGRGYQLRFDIVEGFNPPRPEEISPLASGFMLQITQYNG